MVPLYQQPTFDFAMPMAQLDKFYFQNQVYSVSSLFLEILEYYEYYILQNPGGIGQQSLAVITT